MTPETSSSPSTLTKKSIEEILSSFSVDELNTLIQSLDSWRVVLKYLPEGKKILNANVSYKISETASVDVSLPLSLQMKLSTLRDLIEYFLFTLVKQKADYSNNSAERLENSLERKTP